MLVVRGLRKSYERTPALSGVDFEIDRGEILGLLGPNGSGKSTTVKLVTGLLQPDAGSVAFDGVDLARDPEAYKRRFGYVPEESHLYPYLTGWEYVQLVGRLRGLGEGTIERRAAALFDLWSLGADRHTAVAAYSKGMRQKVMLIAALLHDPELIVLDEPMSGLDATAMLIFRRLLLEWRALGKVVLYSSHELDAVEKTATRVAILSKGRLVACDGVEQLRALLLSPSLEDVFTQLAVREDTDQAALAIAAAVRMP